MQVAKFNYFFTGGVSQFQKLSAFLLLSFYLSSYFSLRILLASAYITHVMLHMEPNHTSENISRKVKRKEKECRPGTKIHVRV